MKFFHTLKVLLTFQGMEKYNDKILQVYYEYGFPVEVLWKKWTTSDGLTSFIGYDNALELVPGGKFEIYFIKENPDGLKGGEGNKILSYLPNKMLSFTWNAPPQYPEVRNHVHRSWVVLEFIRTGASTSKITLNHLGWLDGDEWEAVYAYFEKAWAYVLDELNVSCLNDIR